MMMATVFHAQKTEILTSTATITTTGCSVSTTTLAPQVKSMVSTNTPYDNRTRRLSRDEKGDITDVIYSGGVSVQEKARATGAVEVEFVRSPGLGEGGPVRSLLYSNRGGQISVSAMNARGDVGGKINAAGVLSYEAAYEAFGDIESEAGATEDRQKANTKEQDPHGLINDGFRYRDAETGSFITRDPAGFVDGPNLYTYVRQNPWTAFDPLGLEDQLVGDIYFGEADKNKTQYTGQSGGSDSPATQEYAESRMNKSKHKKIKDIGINGGSARAHAITVSDKLKVTPEIKTEILDAAESEVYHRNQKNGYTATNSTETGGGKLMDRDKAKEILKKHGVTIQEGRKYEWAPSKSSSGGRWQPVDKKTGGRVRSYVTTHGPGKTLGKMNCFIGVVQTGLEIIPGAIMEHQMHKNNRESGMSWWESIKAISKHYDDTTVVLPGPTGFPQRYPIGPNGEPPTI